jgi:hypothetical protein
MEMILGVFYSLAFAPTFKLMCRLKIIAPALNGLHKIDQY